MGYGYDQYGDFLPYSCMRCGDLYRVAGTEVCSGCFYDPELPWNFTLDRTERGEGPYTYFYGNHGTTRMKEAPVSEHLVFLHPIVPDNPDGKPMGLWEKAHRLAGTYLGSRVNHAARDLQLEADRLVREALLRREIPKGTRVLIGADDLDLTSIRVRFEYPSWVIQQSGLEDVAYKKPGKDDPLWHRAREGQEEAAEELLKTFERHQDFDAAHHLMRLSEEWGWSELTKRAGAIAFDARMIWFMNSPFSQKRKSDV